MDTVTILWTLAAGVSLTLGAVCGAVWTATRRDPASLMLCCMGIATAVSAYFELRLMDASTAAEYGELVRWYHLPVAVTLISQVLFVHYYLGTGSTWLLWAVILSRAVVLLVNFALDPNFNFVSITALHQVPLLGDEVTAIASAMTRAGWQKFAMLSLFLIVAYLVDAAVRRWRAADSDAKRKSLAILIGITLPLLGTVIYTQLLVFGVVRTPLSNLPWFLGVLLMMAIELGRDFVVSRRELHQLAEFREQVARSERIGMLGQLASSLMHELTQPLFANAVNAAMALKTLDGTPPNMEELREILVDIDNASRRGTKVVAGMRQLIKLRAVAMQPLRVEDVMNDVASMIRADTRSRKVALSVLVPPDLPEVLGDKVHLSQVLLNLLTNSIYAVQSCPSNARQVVVEARAGDDDVHIQVRDSGPGISEDVADQLFTPFFTTKPEGTGLGLTLSRTIVEAHGGRLWAERTNAPEGATFCFTLQRAEVSA